MHEPVELLENPTLRAGLQKYIDGGFRAQDSRRLYLRSEDSLHEQSKLLFRIVATADYFTTDQLLMLEGQLVTVDIST